MVLRLMAKNAKVNKNAIAEMKLRMEESQGGGLPLAYRLSGRSSYF